MIQQFLGFHGFSFDDTITGVSDLVGRAARHRRAAADDRALLLDCPRSSSSPASAPACRSSTTTRRKSVPTGSRTRSARSTSTAARRSSSTSAPRPRSKRSAPRASTSAARSSPVSRSRSTRCSSARPGLRRVELAAPKHVIGKSTVESIQSGAIYGFAAEVDGLVDRFAAELGECTVIATGGLADHDPAALAHGAALRAVAHALRAPHHLRDGTGERRTRSTRVEARAAVPYRRSTGRTRSRELRDRVRRAARRRRRRPTTIVRVAGRAMLVRDPGQARSS